MPNFKTGDMWTAWDEANLFLITTNAIIITMIAMI